MERRAAKVGITGKYGTRYGQKLRKQVKAIEILQRKKTICPFCGKTAIKRAAAGIWKCRACKRSSAGGAWEFTTTAATTAKTTIHRLKKNMEIKMTPEEIEEEEKELKKDQKKEKAILHMQCCCLLKERECNVAGLSIREVFLRI